MDPPGEGPMNQKDAPAPEQIDLEHDRMGACTS